VSAPEGDDQAALHRVLVLAPYRSDADYLRRLLSEHEIHVDLCPETAGIDDCLAASPGVLVATHEALTPVILEAVSRHLAVQPAWSEMPIVVLLDRTSPNARVRAELSRAWPRARLLFYQRPVTPVELISGLQSALLARLRQREVRDNLEREIELRRELNHRVKNILASVTSIFEMTRRGADTLEGFAEDFRGRLSALSKVHATVFQADGEAVSIAAIVDLTFEPYRLSGTERVVTDGPPFLIGRETATTLALCLHELATNAIKYGALSSVDGQVSFTWGVSEDEVWAIWRESGGPPVVAPSRSGYGTRYLRSALASAFGRPPSIVFDPAGMRCEARGEVSRFARNLDGAEGVAHP
jgi:two-component sensor histidine kinase